MRIIVTLLLMAATLNGCDYITKDGIAHSMHSWCESRPNCQVNDAH